MIDLKVVCNLRWSIGKSICVRPWHLTCSFRMHPGNLCFPFSSFAMRQHLALARHNRTCTPLCKTHQYLSHFVRSHVKLTKYWNRGLEFPKPAEYNRLAIEIVVFSRKMCFTPQHICLHKMHIHVIWNCANIIDFLILVFFYFSCLALVLRRWEATYKIQNQKWVVQ